MHSGTGKTITDALNGASENDISASSSLSAGLIDGRTSVKERYRTIEG